MFKSLLRFSVHGVMIQETEKTGPGIIMSLNRGPAMVIYSANDCIYIELLVANH